MKRSVKRGPIGKRFIYLGGFVNCFPIFPLCLSRFASSPYKQASVMKRGKKTLNGKGNGKARRRQGTSEAGGKRSSEAKVDH